MCGPLLMSPASLLNTIQLFLLFCVPLSTSYTVITIFILISMVLVSLKGQEKRMWWEFLFQSLPVTLPWVAEKGLSSDGNLLSSGWTQKAYASPPCRYEGTGHSIKIDNLAFCVLTTDPEQQNMLQSCRQNWSGFFFFMNPTVLLNVGTLHLCYLCIVQFIIVVKLHLLYQYGTYQWLFIKYYLELFKIKLIT